MIGKLGVGGKGRI